MQPLPVLDYEPSVWSRLKVGTDYLVSDGRNKYSVPYDLIGETVDVRLTRNIVEERFGLLVDAEWNRRQQNKLRSRIQEARLDAPSATMEGIEYLEDRKL
ncbi:MAG: IstB-like ATP-binding domain-containing protein, partial [Clostridia bacterium]|nr:IstB-like ATP-binding domain-containing protein [Clostridia bacterium]